MLTPMSDSKHHGDCTAARTGGGGAVVGGGAASARLCLPPPGSGSGLNVAAEAAVRGLTNVCRQRLWPTWDTPVGNGGRGAARLNMCAGGKDHRAGPPSAAA